MTSKAHFSSSSGHSLRRKFADFSFVDNCTIFFFFKYCTIPSLGSVFDVGERRALVSHDLENMMIHLAPMTQLKFPEWITWLRLHWEGYRMVMQGREWSGVTVIINWEKK